MENALTVTNNLAPFLYSKVHAFLVIKWLKKKFPTR